MGLNRSAAGTGPRRRSRLCALCALTVAGSLLLAPSASANLLTPKSGGSPNADQIHSLYQITLYIAIIVFVVVEGALVYAVYRFRAKKHPVAEQIHGNTRLEMGWTLGAAFILVVLAIVTFIKLPSIVDAPSSDPNGLVLSASTTQPAPPNNGHKLTICVQGRQYIWRYVYGNGCNKDFFAKHLPYSYQTMTVPAHTTIVLLIQASDVIHSWWIPSLGGKVDAVPGYTTYTWFKAEHSGAVYSGQCAQLCGRGHAAMTALVRVVSPAEYQHWIAQQQSGITAANAQVTQLRSILTANGNL